MMDSACAARRCHRVGEGFHFLRAAGDSEGELKVGTLPGLFNCGDIGEDETSQSSPITKASLKERIKRMKRCGWLDPREE